LAAGAAAAAALGASGLAAALGAAGAFGAAGAAAGAGAADEDEDEDDEVSASSPPQATTSTINIEATSNPASIPDLRSIFILINFPPTLIHQNSSGLVYFYAYLKWERTFMNRDLSKISAKYKKNISRDNLYLTQY
jgi:hypothetical protein